MIIPKITKSAIFLCVGLIFIAIAAMGFLSYYGQYHGDWVLIFNRISNGLVAGCSVESGVCDFGVYMMFIFGIIGIPFIIVGFVIQSKGKTTGSQATDQAKPEDSTYRKMLAQAHELEERELFSEASTAYQEIIEYCAKKGWVQAKEWAEKSKKFADSQK